MTAWTFTTTGEPFTIRTTPHGVTITGGELTHTEAAQLGVSLIYLAGNTERDFNDRSRNLD